MKRDPQHVAPPPTRITLKLYASLAEHLPPGGRGNAAPLDVRSGATVADVIAPLHLPSKLVKLVLLNGVFVPPEERATRTLTQGDVLAIWPPIAGG